MFDVVGFNAEDDLVWVGEVETPSNNTDALDSDYEKLASVDAAAVWACEDKDLILEIIETLTAIDTIDISLTSTQTRTISSLRAAIKDHDLPGMDTLHTFRSLKTEINQEQ